MQCFFVEFQCKLGEAYAVADEIANREIASEVYSVSGSSISWPNSILKTMSISDGS
jgi:hypothetical protein